MGVALVLHGHFYQPPRENPWSEEVPREPSAAPFHDWNSRITAECYRPNGRVPIVTGGGEVVDVVDNFRLLSFNVGPTLLSWLELHAPDVYRRIVDADLATGRALAQAYGHAILPLCDDRDLRTQVRWGLADFRHRFGREPAGMWLPETAVDERVLAVLAEEGVGFTLLAPGQVDPVGEGGGPVYRWRHPERPELGIDLVVYDGGLSHAVAFDGLSGSDLVDRALAGGDTGPGDRMVAAACDGETFGHHQAFADRGLAHALAFEAPRRDVDLPRLADLLADQPPTAEATVHTSAWSCAHGVGRWLEDCGCHTGGEPGWNQRWRAPLRAALDVLRDHAGTVFERRGRERMHDPWVARDAYVDVLLGANSLDSFTATHLRREGYEVEPEELVEALTLLESQRHALLMYSSCGWFFNDLAGLETVQILRYAARCCDLLEELGEPVPYDEMFGVLAGAVSNRPEEGDGRDIWERHVAPARVDARRVTANLALGALVLPGHPDRCAGFGVEHEAFDRIEQDGVTVCAGRVTLTHRRTLRRTTWTYGALSAADRQRERRGAASGGAEAVDMAATVPVVAVRPGGDPADDDLAIVRATEAARQGRGVDEQVKHLVDSFGPDTYGLEAALGPDAVSDPATGAGAVPERPDR